MGKKCDRYLRVFEVPRRGNFLVVLGNEASFPRIEGKFSLKVTSSVNS
jgi:hypothetical protein